MSLVPSDAPGLSRVRPDSSIVILETTGACCNVFVALAVTPHHELRLEARRKDILVSGTLALCCAHRAARHAHQSPRLGVIFRLGARDDLHGDSSADFGGPLSQPR